jgi:tetratricopeptide (TPR) repeat protein
VEKPSRNKFVLVLLFLSVLAFLSISIIPLVSGLLNPPTQPTSQSSPGATEPPAETQLLEEQERGYQSVIQREPDNEKALRGLVETRAQLIQQGLRTPKDLIDPLEKLQTAFPEQTDFAILLAQAHQQSGNREAAAKTYREVLEQAPTNANALQGLVSLFLKENKPSAAESLLQNTLQANQTNPPADYDETSIELLLGDVYTAQNNYDKAIVLYDRLLATKPDDYRPTFGKALALRAQGNNDDAQLWFAKAIELAPAQVKDQIKQLSQTPTNPEDSSRSTDGSP